MRFFKSTLPVMIAFVLAVVGITVYFVPHRASANVKNELATWNKLIGGVTIFIGVYSLLRLHYGRIRRKPAGWGYSAVFYVFFVLIVALGIYNNGDGPFRPRGRQAKAVGAPQRDQSRLGAPARPATSQPARESATDNQGIGNPIAGGEERLPITRLPIAASQPGAGAAARSRGNGGQVNDGVQWLFEWIAAPAGATVFSILGFFICSAAYRTFRAKTTEAAVLLVAAVIVMLGQVPLAAVFSDRIPALSGWLLDVPNMAVKRAILFGICLGSVGTSLRVMFGIERSYMGGEK